MLNVSVKTSHNMLDAVISDTMWKTVLPDNPPKNYYLGVFTYVFENTWNSVDKCVYLLEKDIQ